MSAWNRSTCFGTLMSRHSATTTAKKDMNDGQRFDLAVRQISGSHGINSPVRSRKFRLPLVEKERQRQRRGKRAKTIFVIRVLKHRSAYCLTTVPTEEQN